MKSVNSHSIKSNQENFWQHKIRNEKFQINKTQTNIAYKTEQIASKITSEENN